MSIYDYSYTTMSGETVSLESYKGKVLLLVNTASKCGLTPQYEGLEALYKQFSNSGLTIIGFPCNQFAGQEPDDNTAVAEFCKVNFGVTFPLSEKIDVNGENAHELFKFLTSVTKYEGFGDEKFENLLRDNFGTNFSDSSIKWNFTKFLVDREGNITRFEPPVTAENLKEHIEKAIG